MSNIAIQELLKKRQQLLDEQEKMNSQITTNNQKQINDLLSIINKIKSQMKQVLMGLCGIIVIIAIMAFHPFQKQQNIGDCKYGQCFYIKKDGYQCKNCAQKNSIYCWAHNHQ